MNKLDVNWFNLYTYKNEFILDKGFNFIISF